MQQGEELGSTTLQAARGGDREALERLFAVERASLHAQARALTNQQLNRRTSASDLVQESLLKAYRQFPEFRGTTMNEFRVWLLRILQTSFANLRRYHHRTAKRSQAREIEAGSAGDWSPANGVYGRTPSSIVVLREQSEQLATAITQLRPEHRAVIYHRHFDQLSFRQIGDTMGRSESAAKSLWSRAMIALGTELRRNGD